MILSHPIVYGLGEIDTSNIVSEVIDGVSFKTRNQEFYKLADIEPTCTDVDNSTGFISAKNLLGSLILNKNVYLDIDNQYVTDYFGTGNRTVCVVYIDFNSTHYLNVNQVIIEQRLVIINDSENDFNPKKWSFFVEKRLIPEFSFLTIPALFIIITFGIMIFKKLNFFNSSNI